MLTRFITLLLFCFLISCGTKTSSPSGNYKDAFTKDTIEYAHGFSINRFGRFTLLKVHNPWEGAKGIEYKYLLCPAGEKIPDSLKNIPIIHTPVKRIICLSTTHIALLSFINEVTSIVGVSGPNYISDSLTRLKIKEGKISDIGFDQALNYENIVSIKPDMVLAYGIQGETASQYKKLENLGIKVVLNAEYLEETALGKFEWVKFVAAFFNKTELATKKFNDIAKEYKKYAALCSTIKDKPQILSGIPWKGVWYVPGGSSYGANLINDAGGNYLWSDSKQRESLPLNFEKVIEKAGNATIWINTDNTNSKKDILAEDPRLGKIQPFILNNIYNNNARMNSSGGNDFWESGVTHPDILLKDMIKIFHPELLPQYSLVYYKKLD